jgi:nucleotidyltransferase substrate binding protein (TIGR01987 family)
MIEIKEFESKFKYLESALTSLKSSIILDRKNENEEIKSMLRDSCIQRFEYSYELSWKFMKYILEKHDTEIETRSPKQALKTAFKN